MDIDFQLEVKRCCGGEVCYCKVTACLGIFCVTYRISQEADRNRSKEYLALESALRTNHGKTSLKVSFLLFFDRYNLLLGD